VPNCEIRQKLFAIHQLAGLCRLAGRLLRFLLASSQMEGEMKTPLLVLAGVLVVGIPFASAEHGRHAVTREQVVVESPRNVHVVFTSGDVRVLREYYAPRYRRLPPGLQKKLARTGQLPPGWQRRIEPIPVVVERQLVVLPADYRRGVIDGNAVIYSSRRGIVFDATVLF